MTRWRKHSRTAQQDPTTGLYNRTAQFVHHFALLLYCFQILTTTDEMTVEFQTPLDLYQYGAIIFYAGYGVLCWFLFKPYCRHIYFRGNYPQNPRWRGAVGGAKRWTEEFHSTDAVMDYMTRGEVSSYFSANSSPLL